MKSFFQGLFFIVCVMSELFANVSGMSLIYLLWRIDFLFTHGTFIVVCKVGRATYKKLFHFSQSTYVFVMYWYTGFLIFKFTYSVLRRTPPTVSPDGGCWTQLESKGCLVDLRPLHPAYFPRCLHLLLDVREIWGEGGGNYNVIDIQSKKKISL